MSKRKNWDSEADEAVSEMHDPAVQWRARVIVGCAPNTPTLIIDAIGVAPNAYENYEKSATPCCLPANWRSPVYRIMAPKRNGRQ